MKSLGLPLLRSVIVFDGRDELRNAAKYPAARSVGSLVAGKKRSTLLRGGVAWISTPPLTKLGWVGIDSGVLHEPQRSILMSPIRSTPYVPILFLLLGALLFLFVAPVLLVSAHAQGSASQQFLLTKSANGPVMFLPGLGTAHPSRPNISTDSEFAVYEWNVPFTRGGKVYQVDSMITGKVIAIVTVLPKGTHVYPLPETRLNRTQSEVAGGVGMAPAAAGCPCTYKTTDLSGGGSITVVTGSARDVISVVAECPSGTSCTVKQ